MKNEKEKWMHSPIPELAFCTVSAARRRMVFTHLSSNDDISMGLSYARRDQKKSER